MAEAGTLNNSKPTAWSRSPQPTALAAQTLQWLTELPRHLRPDQLAAGYPHIANKLAALWTTPDECRRYFDDVLLDRRGNRKGLPERVAMELAALKNHFDSAKFPTHQTVWDEIISRARG